MTSAPARGRAPALPADERRRAIVEAVVPLLVAHGAAVTTRQIAEAAGVAEGTLFRVFDDKASLLHAAAHAMFDPDRLRRGLSAVDPALPLAGMVTAVVDLLLRSTRETMAVLMAVRAAGGMHPGGDRPGPPPFVRDAHLALLEGLAELFGRYRTELRVAPDRAALLLRALVFGARQPWADDGQALTADEITTVLLAGLAGPPEQER